MFMKKKAIFALVLLYMSLSEAAYPPMVEIECTIAPIERSKIHPKASEDTPSQTRSSNWSGYVAATSLTDSTANGTVTYVAGSWVAPTVTSAATGDCAIWVGIDGYQIGSGSVTVEQIGTSHNWNNDAKHYFAWFEMYPVGSFEIKNFPVNDGDVISARVGYKGNNVFKLEIFNHTQGVSTVVPSSYTMTTHALRSSAEWIVEAPSSNVILPLSDFQTVTFNNCSTVINGISGTIINENWMADEITMVGSSDIKAQPSALSKNGTCFQVTWENAQ
jgi:hypothetical protein